MPTPHSAAPRSAQRVANTLASWRPEVPLCPGQLRQARPRHIDGRDQPIPPALRSAPPPPCGAHTGGRNSLAGIWGTLGFSSGGTLSISLLRSRTPTPSPHICRTHLCRHRGPARVVAVASPPSPHLSTSTPQGQRPSPSLLTGLRSGLYRPAHPSVPGPHGLLPHLARQLSPRSAQPHGAPTPLGCRAWAPLPGLPHPESQCPRLLSARPGGSTSSAHL